VSRIDIRKTVLSIGHTALFLIHTKSRKMRNLKKYSLITICSIATSLLIGCGHQRIRFVKTGTPGIEKRVSKESRIAEETYRPESIRIAEDETVIEEDVETYASVNDEIESYNLASTSERKIEYYSSSTTPEDSVSTEEVVTPEMRYVAEKAESNAKAAKITYIIGALFFWTVIIDLLLLIIGSVLLMSSSKAPYITSEGVRQAQNAKIALIVAASLVVLLLLTFLVLITLF
jgi:hypothetical protein